MASLDSSARTQIEAVEDVYDNTCGPSRSSAAESVVPFTGATLQSLVQRSMPRRVSAGRDVTSEGAGSPECVSVQEGWVAPYKLLCDGRRQLLDILMEGDSIRVCRDPRGRAFHSIVALTDACVVEGAVRDLARCGAIDHDGDPCAAPVLAEQQRRMMDRMAILGHGRAAERLAACLLDLWQRQKARGNIDGLSCPMPIRQSDLGDAVGLTSVHVCRTLTIFRRLGLIEMAGGQMTIFSPDRVAFIGGLDTERRAG